MTVYDLLKDRPPETVQVRYLFNEKDAQLLEAWDCYLGRCEWTGTELISKDGDIYTLDVEIGGFLETLDGLQYWIKGE